MLELLAQSHGGKVSLLPALPADWANGNLKGMRLRGSFTLDMSWTSGKLQSATLSGKCDSSVEMLLPEGDYILDNGKGETTWAQSGKGIKVYLPNGVLFLRRA